MTSFRNHGFLHEFSRAFWSSARRHSADRRNARKAPPFELRDSRNRLRSLEEFLGRTSLFLFTSPHCEPCRSLYSRLSDIAACPGWRVVLFSRAATATNARLLDEIGLEDLAILGSRREVEADYRVSFTPYAVLVSAEGSIIDSGPADAGLLSEMAKRAAHPLLASH